MKRNLNMNWASFEFLKYLLKKRTIRNKLLWCYLFILHYMIIFEHKIVISYFQIGTCFSGNINLLVFTFILSRGEKCGLTWNRSRDISFSSLWTEHYQTSFLQVIDLYFIVKSSKHVSFYWIENVNLVFWTSWIKRKLLTQIDILTYFSLLLPFRRILCSFNTR